jgi:hypothetical protein
MTFYYQLMALFWGFISMIVAYRAHQINKIVAEAKKRYEDRISNAE